MNEFTLPEGFAAGLVLGFVVGTIVTVVLGYLSRFPLVADDPDDPEIKP